jgi:hypothetical protein
MSVWSNISYLIAGALSGDPVFAICMTLLGASSAYSHQTKDWIWDWIGMYLVFGYLMLIKMPFVFALYAPISAYLSYVFNFMSYVALGVIWFVVWAMTGFDLLSLGVFASALSIRQIGQVYHYEVLHSLWHVMTAFGLWRIHHVIG